MINGHGGNIREAARRIGCPVSAITDMSSNLNPLGPPPGLLEHLTSRMEAIVSLPEVDGGQCIEAMAAEYRVLPGNVLAGNGTTQFIYTIPQALGTRKALVIGPTYADYASSCMMHGTDFDFLLARESDDFIPEPEHLIHAIPGHDTVFLCNPGNPTGALLPVTQIAHLAGIFPDTFFIVDESYLPFVPIEQQRSAASLALPNVLVLNSMSKIFRMPGLRVGFLIGAEETIEKFTRYRLPWNVNALAQEAVFFIRRNKAVVRQFLAESNSFFIQEKEVFTRALADQAALKIYPSTTYFLLARLPHGQTAADAWNYLLKQKLLIRNCDNFAGLDNRFIRFSLKQRAINLQLAEHLKKFCPAH